MSRFFLDIPLPRLIASYPVNSQHLIPGNLLKAYGFKDRLYNFGVNGKPCASVIYLDWRLFGAAGRRLSSLAVDLVILQPAWCGSEAVERLERRIYPLTRQFGSLCYR